jgi:hypothetical protein
MNNLESVDNVNITSPTTFSNEDAKTFSYLKPTQMDFVV